MTEQHAYMKSAVSSLGLTPDDDQIDLLLRYYELILDQNQTMNLTRITGFEEAVWKHMVDSLSLIRAADVRKNCKILDLGSGAGFPGIPIKIMFPETEVLMVDSVGKKVRFINRVIEELQLDRALGLHTRAEELARDKKYREKYDICVSRAVANLTALSEYCLPFVKTGGMWIAYKGPDCDPELEDAAYAIKTLGGSEAEKVSFQINEMDRTLIKVKKIKKTPMQYPRKAGTAAKMPLRETPNHK